jgi:DNA polymerase I-like protein with 3'-5' exonuclease and polymerase domains
MLTFDFETEAIVGNPIFNPPKPVGVSIKSDDEGSEYLAWGHPTKNNCTWEQGRARLIAALKRDSEWLAHNSPFEAAILRKWFNIRKGNPLKFHDTQYLVFFYDPYAMSLSLKPSAERILGIPPDEQDELKEWILRNVPGVKPSEWGAHICKAPGDIVGKYAGDSKRTGAPGDTDRTKALFDHCMAYVEENDMLEAYERELKLAPILSESSVRGMRVDCDKLAEDLDVYLAAKKASEDYIHGVLGDFNLDSDREFAKALEDADQITEWVLTPTGKKSTARKNLVGRVRDPALLEHIAYRGVLATCLGTFAQPWLSSASAHAGRLHPQWNQVRGDRGQDGDLSGTRTGRMSCREPNLQNVPNDFETLVVPKLITKLLDKHRKKGWQGEDVIWLRRYLLPEDGHIWLKRDFSAQEMRIMAHFAEGTLFNAYKVDPTVDPHAMVQVMLKDMLGIDLPRKFLKIIAFGIMYGRGIPNLSAALGVSELEGKRFRDAYYQLLPEVRELAKATRRAGGQGTGIRTWGGRLYFREPDPSGRDLSYKLLNYLIQGSAADQTKQSMIDWYDRSSDDHHLIAAVHDEINISVPTGQAKRGMKELREAMDAERFDVPFRSEGFAGPNWADIVEYA